jgi:hypothetical protein
MFITDRLIERITIFASSGALIGQEQDKPEEWQFFPSAFSLQSAIVKGIHIL